MNKNKKEKVSANLFYIGAVIGIIFVPFIMVGGKQAFSSIQERLSPTKKIEHEKLIEQEQEIKKQIELEKQKMSVKAVLSIFTISNQMIRDKEKICHEIKGSDEQYSKLRILSDELWGNIKEFPKLAYNFKENFNNDIVHETVELSQLIHKALLGFPFCEENKSITSNLIQQKRLMLGDNLRKALLEKEKEFIEVAENK